MSDTITTAASGRFQPGNTAACGHSSRSQKLRGAILAAISVDDVSEITATLIQQAKAGDQVAAKLLLGYIGKAPELPGVAVQVVNQLTEPGAGRGLALRIAERIRAARLAENR